MPMDLAPLIPPVGVTDLGQDGFCNLGCSAEREAKIGHPKRTEIMAEDFSAFKEMRKGWVLSDRGASFLMVNQGRLPA